MFYDTSLKQWVVVDDVFSPTTLTKGRYGDKGQAEARLKELQEQKNG